MTTPQVAVLVVLGLTVVGAGFLSGRVMRRARQMRIARFATRDPLSIDELSAAYFPGVPPEIVEACLEKISHETGIDASRLRPGDRFDVELKLPPGYWVTEEWADLDDDIRKLPRNQQPQSWPHTIGSMSTQWPADRKTLRRDIGVGRALPRIRSLYFILPAPLYDSCCENSRRPPTRHLPCRRGRPRRSQAGSAPRIQGLFCACSPGESGVLEGLRRTRGCARLATSSHIA